MEDDEPRKYASSPCMAHAFGEDQEGQTARREIFRWRKAERDRLIRLRLKIASSERAACALQIANQLDLLVAELKPRTVSLYWPLKGEPNLIGWADRLIEQNILCSLPVVVEKKAPMIFRPWRPGDAMVKGIWNIPVPAAGDAVTPDLVLSPLVGFDADGYRLGYGGGFFDRTLVSLPTKPYVVGVGYEVTAIASIQPLCHDIPMDCIVTDSQTTRYQH